MDLRLLEIFARVYEERSFSRAAGRLGLTQPTVSSHIKTFEEALGTLLFDRLGREIEPTAAGRFLYAHGRPILELKETLAERMARFLGRLEGSLALGASTIPGEYLLPPLLAGFHDTFPGVRVTVRIKDTAEIVDDVHGGRAQLGFVGARLDRPELEFRNLATDRLVVVAPAGKERSPTDGLDLRGLRGEPLLVREPGSGTRLALERRLRDAGLRLEDFRVIAELGSTSAVREAVKRGVGLTVISQRAVETEVEAGLLAIVPVRGLDPLERTFFTVVDRRRAPAPAAEAFLEYLAAHPI